MAASDGAGKVPYSVCLDQAERADERGVCPVIAPALNCKNTLTNPF